MPGDDRGAEYLRSGKVRDLYALDGDRLLLVASDRISAFDVVLPTRIPDKGRVLTGLSRYWFRESDAAGIVANHLLSVDPADLPEGFADDDPDDDLHGRMMICRRLSPLPVEIIVRGYVSGSGWKDYQRTGAISGIRLPEGLRESDRLPQPIFTPSTKAERGHDVNIDFDRDGAAGGRRDRRARTGDRPGAVQLRGGAGRSRRIILADTKFELGLTPDGISGRDLVLIDEVMTPDSSRFWDASAYEPGRGQPSFDKQYVRDWLETQPWDKTPPGPELPQEVVDGTRARYVEAYERITGALFSRYLDEDVIG